MCAQFDLLVMCRRPKKREDHLVFINFGINKFTIKNTHKKRL
jgi:hypothetical protein